MGFSGSQRPSTGLNRNLKETTVRVAIPWRVSATLVLKLKMTKLKIHFSKEASGAVYDNGSTLKADTRPSQLLDTKHANLRHNVRLPNLLSEPTEVGNRNSLFFMAREVHSNNEVLLLGTRTQVALCC